jgi:hypothetical protein
MEQEDKELWGSLWREDLVGWEPASNEVSVEAEKSSVLEAVSKKRLMKTQQTVKT